MLATWKFSRNQRVNYVEMLSRDAKDQGGIFETVFCFYHEHVIFWGWNSEILKPEQSDMQ